MTHTRICVAAGFLAIVVSFGAGVTLAQSSGNSEEYSEECSEEYSEEYSEDEWGSGACLLRPSAGALAHDSTLHELQPFRIGDASFVRFREDIRLDAELSDEELARQELHLWRYHQRGGNHSRMRKVAKLAERLQCREGCMAAVFTFLPRAHEFGVGHRKATTMCIRALQDELRTRRRMKRTRTNEQLIESLNARLQSRLQHWQQAHANPKGRRRGQTTLRGFGAL